MNRLSQCVYIEGGAKCDVPLYCSVPAPYVKMVTSIVTSTPMAAAKLIKYVKVNLTLCRVSAVSNYIAKQKRRGQKQK